MKKLLLLFLVIAAAFAVTVHPLHADDACSSGPADDPQCE